jgi:hypothetical protein
MNIAGLTAQTNLPVDSVTVGVAVLAKNLDTIEQAGQGMIKMMEHSVQPNVGQNIDLKV